MGRKARLVFLLLLFLLFSEALSAQPISSAASESQDVKFDVISRGDISGYEEETYLVVRSQIECLEMWEKHTTPYLSEIPYPEIVWNGEVVICAFMGERPTTGHNVSIERVWVDEERLHVQVIKCSPPKDVMVCTVITFPYILASTQATAMEVIFHVCGEDGTKADYILPEFAGSALPIILFVMVFTALAAMKRRQRATACA